MELTAAKQKQEEAEKFYNDLVQYKSDVDAIISSFSTNIGKIYAKKLELEKGKQSVVSTLSHIKESMTSSAEYGAIELSEGYAHQ